MPSVLCRCADVWDILLRHRHSHDSVIAEIEAFCRGFANAGIIPITCGGDHSISYPTLKALVRHGPVGLIHFDSHCDTGDEHHGSRFHRGAPSKRAVEAGVVDPRRTVQIGIRGRAEVLWRFSYEQGVRVIHVEESYDLGWRGVVEEIRRVVGEGAVYLSFDVDCLDPAYAPGTGTPEVGGITTFEAQQGLRGLRGLNSIGGDLVEVSPPYDSAGITALAGAHLLFHIVALAADVLAGKKPGRQDPAADGLLPLCRCFPGRHRVHVVEVRAGGRENLPFLGKPEEIMNGSCTSTGKRSQSFLAFLKSFSKMEGDSRVRYS